MTPRLCACLAAGLVLLGLDTVRAGEPLSGAQIEIALTGATTGGVNAYGNPYTVHILAGGRTEGVAGFSDEYRDSGSWWIEGDAYCRRWDTWLDGQTACFSVLIADGKITWLDTTTGNVVVEDFTPPQ
jgi:GntR family transcriptional regulator/MocR family aminotransferase